MTSFNFVVPQFKTTASIFHAEPSARLRWFITAIHLSRAASTLCQTLRLTRSSGHSLCVRLRRASSPANQALEVENRVVDDDGAHAVSFIFRHQTGDRDAIIAARLRLLFNYELRKRNARLRTARIVDEGDEYGRR